MTRTLGFVPVRVGRAVVPVTVEAEEGATTHFDVSASKTRIVVASDLGLDAANREVEALLPELQRELARKLLN